MQRFRHGRVLFAGDAAHVVSPFGARGANSGFQDADNLVWKLRLVLDGSRAGAATRQLRRRANRRGRREHPAFDPRDRFHHAEEPRCRARFAMRCSLSPSITRSRGSWSTAAGCRCRTCIAIRRSTRPIAMPARISPARWCPAPPRPMLRSRAPTRPGSSTISHDGFTLLAFGDAVPVEAAEVARARPDPMPGRAGRRAGSPRGRIAVRDSNGLLRGALRRQTRDVLPSAARPARLRALAALRSGRRARRDSPRDVQRPRICTMSTLNTEPNLAAPDDFYEDLIALHRDLSESESALVNAKLDPAPRQSHRRSRSACRGDGRGARGRRAAAEAHQ